MARNHTEDEAGPTGGTGLGLLVLGFSSALFGAMVIGPSLGERLQPHSREAAHSEQRSAVVQASLPATTGILEKPAAPEPVLASNRAETPAAAPDHAADAESAASPVETPAGVATDTGARATASAKPASSAEPLSSEAHDVETAPRASSSDEKRPAAKPVRTKDEEPAAARVRVPARTVEAEVAVPARPHSARRTDDEADDEKPIAVRPHTPRRVAETTADDKPRHRARTEASDEDEKPRRPRVASHDEEPRHSKASDDEDDKPRTRRVRPTVREAAAEPEATPEKPKSARERHARRPEAEPEAPVKAPEKRAKVAEKPKVTAPREAAAPTAEDGDLKLYRVRVGRFRSREEADKARDEVTSAAGTEASVIHVGESYRLQLGAYKQRVNADKVADTLRGKNYRPDVTEGKRTKTTAPAEPKPASE